MALLAAVAVALAAWCAAWAQGGAGVGAVDIPPVVLALALVPGVALTAARRSVRVLPPGKDVVVLTAVTVAGAGATYVAGWTNVAHLAVVARLLPPAVAALGVLWPEPGVLRYCLVLCAGSLLGGAVGSTGPGLALVGALAALAVALVATNRLTAAGAPRLGGPPITPGRRVGAEATAVLAVAGLLAALAAQLLPPPQGRGGAQQDSSRGPRRPVQASAPLQATDRLDVGGPRGKPTNAVLFRVAADGPDLWRATTYDHWDGEAWERSPDPFDQLQGDTGQGFNLDIRGRTFVRPGIGDTGVARATFVQRVTIEASAASVLVAAARPVWVSLPGRDVLVGADATLRPEPALGRGESYVVESVRAEADPATLRAAPPAATTTDTTDADVAERYLQLPQVPAAVRALAVELTRGAPTPYDKARAVEAWLQDNTRVTETATAVPAGADPIETFLLTDRAGPAERAATSMAVMLRAVGMPSRLAVGFLPGRRAGLSGDFVVRGRDGHAWVEVWFPGVGWQRFDPTGLAPPPGTRDDSLWSRLTRLARQLWPLLVLVVLAAAGWATWRGLRWWRRRAAEPWATRFFARLERAGRIRGRPRQPQETPAEYTAGLAESVLPDPRLAEVGELVTIAAWSRHEVAPEDRAGAERVLREAARAAPAWRNRLRRAQGPTIRQP